MLPIATPDGQFNEGNPYLDQLGTSVTAAWLNQVQADIIGVITAAGLQPGPVSQLVTALNILYGGIRAEVQRASLIYAPDTGALNAYRATYAPAYTVLTDGSILIIQAGSTNTGPATFAPNGLVVKPIVGQALAPLSGGEITQTGKAMFMYHAALASWVLIHAQGGAQQITAGTASNHAATVGQVNASVRSINPYNLFLGQS